MMTTNDVSNSAAQGSTDTIAAPATPSGRGGVGIIRISGPQATHIALQLCGRSSPLIPRHAHFQTFYDANQQVLDEGLVLYFPAPHSFTGEDVVELQGHGGPVVINSLLQATISAGARMALPGEFSERAFLNDKLDLAQAEAIADLIDASSAQAAQSAMRSLQGVFSDKIEACVHDMTQLRMYVEAAIDFPEEEIDFISEGKVLQDVLALQDQLTGIFQEANNGVRLREGMNVVLAGKPNAGKSSLLNVLAGSERAIVTDIEGTTRDLVTEAIHVDGMPLHITDTAGLRHSDDPVEQEGIRRAWQSIEAADRVLYLVDASRDDFGVPLEHLSIEAVFPEYVERFPHKANVTLVCNKVDLLDSPPMFDAPNDDQKRYPIIGISAKTQQGTEKLRDHLKEVMGYHDMGQSSFTARQRHLDALSRAQECVERGLEQLQNQGAAELLAEELRQAQEALGEITGKITPDELLGKIFSSFCIGK